MRARDAAVLTAGVALYDLIATGFLPLTDNLIGRLEEIPVAPVVRWGPVSIGIGDLLILTLLPVVYRKAFGDTAGIIALTTGILGIVTALVLRANGPLMTDLGAVADHRVRHVAANAGHGAHDLAVPAQELESTKGGNMRRYHSAAVIAASSVIAFILLIQDVSAQGKPAELLTFNSSGFLLSLSTTGPVVDPTSPFFRSLGTNGRSCVTCHVPGQDWSITPPDVRRRFEITAGMDPIFRTNDGSNAPNADVSTVEARRRAFSMLLNRGVIRVGMPVPPDAEFDLIAVDDPYGFASATELSLFRRPLPSANLRFLNTVMWDGRETLQKLLPTNSQEQNLAALRFDLRDQANGATRGHAQASRDLTETERQQIVDFETGLSTAQVFDFLAGALMVNGAAGGPRQLLTQPSFVGINDLTVDSTTSAADGRTSGASHDPVLGLGTSAHTPAQAAVARGEALFNARSDQCQPGQRPE